MRKSYHQNIKKPTIIVAFLSFARFAGGFAGIANISILIHLEAATIDRQNVYIIKYTTLIWKYIRRLWLGRITFHFPRWVMLGACVYPVLHLTYRSIPPT